MRRLRIALFRAVLALASAGPLTNAAASPPAGADPATAQDLPLEGEVTSPNWRSLPSGDDMAKEYPKLAEVMNLSGEAVIKCVTDTEGRLQDCKVLSESPSGFGFGPAAMRLSAYFSMKPALLDGQPIKSTVTIPIRFALADRPPPAVEPEPPPTSAAALRLARQILSDQGIAERLRSKWRPATKRLFSEAVVNGDIQSSAPALDAFQQALDDVVQAVLDHQARLMAAKMTEADLLSTLSYFDSPAGKSWLTTGLDLSFPDDFSKRLFTAAHTRLCASVACDAQGRPNGALAAGGD
jgi:TonB family protein